MIVLSKEMPKDTFNLILAGDTHYGTKMRSRSGTNALISDVARPNNYLVFMGDAIESITGSDRRYDPDVSDGSTPLQQAEEVARDFHPVRKKVVTWLAGNHETTIKGVGNVVRESICKDLQIPYGTYSCRVSFTHKGRLLFKGLFHHGNGSIGSTHPDPMVRMAIQTYKLKQKLEPFGGDCLLNAMGHTHKLLVYEPADAMFMRDASGKLEARYTKSIRMVMHDLGYVEPCHRWYANTGGFLKLYSKEAMSGYAEISMYPPIEVGYIKVRVVNGTIMGVEKVYV
jgi:hypothetical protein